MPTFIDLKSYKKKPRRQDSTTWRQQPWRGLHICFRIWKGIERRRKTTFNALLVIPGYSKGTDGSWGKFTSDVRGPKTDEIKGLVADSVPVSSRTPVSDLRRIPHNIRKCPFRARF